MDIIKNLAYISQEHFWLKEALLTLQACVIFTLVWWIATLKHEYRLLILLSAFLGGVCNIIGDLEYWNDNDVLKHVAPASLYLIIKDDKERRSHIMLFAFLCPFFIISYAPESIFTAGSSVIFHFLIYLFIVIVRKSICLSTFISVLIGLLYYYIGSNASPGTNDNLVNPVLITLYTKGIDYYVKKDKNTLFLKCFWIVLLCFAFIGNWIFHYLSDYYDVLIY